MLVWSFDKTIKFRHHYQAYNIKGIGTVEPLDKDYSYSKLDVNKRYILLKDLVELDEDTHLPIYLSNSDLENMFPLFQLVQDSLKILGIDQTSSYMMSVVLLQKIGNTTTRNRPREIPYSIINKICQRDIVMGSVTRIIEKMLYKGVANEYIILFLETVLKENMFSNKMISPKTILVIKKVLEIMDLLWRNQNARNS